MTEKGEIAVAGHCPFSDPGELRGVTIFRVRAEETAKLVQDDPTVKPESSRLKSIRGSLVKGCSYPDSPCNNINQKTVGKELKKARRFRERACT